MSSRLLVASALALVAACATVVEPPGEAGSRAKRIYADYFEANLRLNPLTATAQGDHRYNAELPNFLSSEHRRRQLQLETDALHSIRAINPASLARDDRLSYEVFREERELAIAAARHPSHLLPINQFYNVANDMARLGSGEGSQPFRDVQDYQDWLMRIDGFVVVLDQAIENMREGVRLGIVQPRALMVKVLPQLAAQRVESAEDSLFFGPVESFPDTIGPEDRERLTRAYRAKIDRVLLPAYGRLHDFIRDDYLPAARETAGLGALPGGDAWYRHLVRAYTSTALTPDQIHKLGLAEVERIRAEMRDIVARVEFDGDLSEFFRFVTSDPRFVFSSRAALLAAYESRRATVESHLPGLFSLAPESDFEIRLVEPYREASSSAASYQRGSADGQRKGIFYVNAYDLSARPTWAVESLYLHEAQPGHHFQIALQQELTELPAFRRFGRHTAYSEGWGLYAESLGGELGLYQDPYQVFGALSAELWRAIRLVVDTGLHAKGWSREQVLEYMYAHAPVAPARAISETERFMAIPGQALAYKIGQLKIVELRERSRRALGASFDIREFHRRVLEDGALPLAVLEAKIDRWIDESR